jgi:hypothetical protein
MLSPRRYDDSDEGLDEWNFMTVYNWGEDPKGMWRLKITDNPNQEQENMFGEDNDVEELEEQVIDAQAKMQKAKWDERRKKEPYFDEPYPPGVRKEKVVHQDPVDELKAEEEESQVPSFLSEDDQIEYDRSNIAFPFVAYNHGKDKNPKVKRSAEPEKVDTEESDKNGPIYNQYILPSKKGVLAVFDEQSKVEDESDVHDDASGSPKKRSNVLAVDDDDESDIESNEDSNSDDEIEGESPENYLETSKVEDYDEEDDLEGHIDISNQERDKKDLIDDEKSNTFDYYNRLRKKTSVYGRDNKKHDTRLPGGDSCRLK